MMRRSDEAPTAQAPDGRTGRHRRAAVRPADAALVLLALALVASPLVLTSRGGAATTGTTASLTGRSGQARPHVTFSFRPWISGDGRWVAFDSDSHDLVSDDISRVRNIFVYDRDNRTVELVSKAPGGRPADGDSQRPTVSGDGRYVAYWSAADNLVDGDTNRVTDCFVTDRQTHRTVRVDVGADDVQANGACARPVISGDGRLVAFESSATNLGGTSVVPKPLDRNRTAGRNIFVRDVVAGTTTCVSLADDGTPGTALPNGRTGESVRPSISADGRWIAFQSNAALDPDDKNGKTDVYVRDMAGHGTNRISVGPGGVDGDGGSYSPSVSADGRYVAYWSNASNLVAGDTNRTADIFLFDRRDGSTVRISVSDRGVQGDGLSSDPSISPDGRYVTFWSAADNLVAGDTNGKRDIFLADRAHGTLMRVSVADDGTQGDGDSYSPSVSGGGGVVAFDSVARTLVPDDRKVKGSDVFLHWDGAPPGGSPAP